MITPSSIAFSKASLPIAALASSIALDLSVILAFLLISASASFSSCSKAALRAASKAASDSHLSKEHYGDRLIFDDEYITCEKDSYLIRKNKDDSFVESIEIKQNADGIDIEDRIIVLKNYIEKKYIDMLSIAADISIAMKQ